MENVALVLSVVGGIFLAAGFYYLLGDGLVAQLWRIKTAPARWLSRR